jgi:hypothetical protein
MIRKLEYYSGLKLEKAGRYMDQMIREFGEIRDSYAVDAPNHGKPLQYHHQRMLDRFFRNIQVLRQEPEVTDQFATFPHREFTILWRLGLFEQEIHEFRESLRENPADEAPRQG